MNCDHCGEALPAPKRGQRQKFCTARCRVAASRQSLCVTELPPVPVTPTMRNGGSSGAPAALEDRQKASELVHYLRRMRFIGRVSPRDFALLVPRNIALAELNLNPEMPVSDADLTHALREMRVADYPSRSPAVAAPIRPLLDVPRVDHHGPSPGALQGDDYQLEFEDGYPKLPACLDRRRA
jgi:hypothetical protein